MLERPEAAFGSHEGDLPVREGYSAWKERVVLRSLTDAQAALDFGAGRQSLDDPCVIRMDLHFHPHVDVVGDVHRLPFKDGTVDFAFGGAVMEHLARPWDAAREIFRVLKPGGYVYADWCFLVAYHGYPHHYFNATIHGLREVFRDFEILELEVGPFHGSPYALRSVIGTFLEHFSPSSQVEREFVSLLHTVLWHPLERHDRRLAIDERFRVAAGAHVLGMRPMRDGDALAPVRQVIAALPHVASRFPQPLNLGVPDNIMLWARSEEGRSHACVRDVLDAPGFDKRGRSPAPRRDALLALPPELMTEPYPLADAAEKARRLYFSRRFRDRLREGWEKRGALGMAGVFARSALHASDRLRAHLRMARPRPS